MKTIGALLILMLAVSEAFALTASDRVATITWDDPKSTACQYEFRGTTFAMTGWLGLGTKPTAPATFQWTFGPVPTNNPDGSLITDRYVGIDARTVCPGIAPNIWLS